MFKAPASKQESILIPHHQTREKEYDLLKVIDILQEED